MSARTVVFLIETLNRGGVENVLLRVIPCLNAVGWHSVVMTIGYGGEMLSEYESAGISVVSMSSKSAFHPKAIVAIGRHLRRLKPDLVVTTLIRADLIGRLILAPIVQMPVVSYIGTTYNYPRYWLARLFERITKSMAHHYIANSIAVKESYVTHLGVREDKITVVANGLDISTFQAADGASVGHELQLPSNAFVITCVGNLAPNKRHSDLITAFERAFADAPDTRLLLVGEGEMRPALQAQIEASTAKDRIVLLGRRTDVPSILKITMVFVLPTLFEGMSNALMEAMAAGKAIVTTNIPENRVLLTDNETALLVSPNAPDELAHALLRLYKDESLRYTLGEGALQNVVVRYSLEQCAKNFASAFQKVCGR